MSAYFSQAAAMILLVAVIAFALDTPAPRRRYGHSKRAREIERQERERKLSRRILRLLIG